MECRIFQQALACLRSRSMVWWNRISHPDRANFNYLCFPLSGKFVVPPRDSRCKMKTPMNDAPKRLEPRWPAMLALLAVGGLRLAMPESLSAGPDWLLIAVVAVLMIPTV